jgi:hypothetical protein
MGDVIENSASTVNDLLGDPYNNVKEICGRTRCVEIPPSSAYGNRQGNPMNTTVRPPTQQNGLVRRIWVFQIILPITELAGHE